MEASRVRDAGNKARLERWIKVLGMSLLTKKGKWPDLASQHDEVEEKTGSEGAHKACLAVFPGVAQ